MDQSIKNSVLQSVNHVDQSYKLLSVSQSFNNNNIAEHNNINQLVCQP